MRWLPKDDNKHGWTIFVWLIYLSFFLVVPALKHASAWEWTATIAAVLIFLPLYLRGYSVRGRDVLPVIAGITLLGVVFYPFNPGAGSFFIYGAAFACRIGGSRATLRAILLIEFVLCVEIWLFHVPIYNAWWPVLFAVIVGGVNSHYEEVNRSNRRLHLAQDEIERLAKLAERERIGRDLHDLLGHTLSLIVLKSELASKLTDRDPQRARDEIRDVERISRDALAEVRQAVAGYRSGGFRNELDSAQNMLRTATIECATEIEKISMAPAQEAILSLALREAVTNVVRHSHAAHCTIRLARVDGALQLTVADDGQGGDAAEGYGLTGMRERLASIGGSLARDTSHGTTLVITMPADRAMERSA